MRAKLTRWTIFSVLLALVPLLVSALIRATRRQAADLDTILSNGELLLITVGLAGAAVGELIGSGRGVARPMRELISAGMSVVILVVSALYFADVAAAKAAAQVVDSPLIASVSLGVYVAALISSGACIALAE
jgi:hypothetical protein